MEANHMDLPDLVPIKYKSIQFKLSEYFIIDQNANYALRSNSRCFFIPSLSLFFSVEQAFSDINKKLQKKELEDRKNWIHKQFIESRLRSIKNGEPSLLKTILPSQQNECLIQIVNENSDNRNKALTYFVATIEKNQSIYTFQLIGKKSNMVYLYDDFIQLLSSVHQ